MRIRWLLPLMVLGLFSACDDGMPARLAVGDPLPAFSLKALDGSMVDSDSLAGQIAVVNFWATWCQPCLKEIPELKQLASEDQLEVIGIALDEEGAAAVQPFVENHEMRYKILLGDQEVFTKMGGFSIPFTLVVDASTRIVSVYRGAATRADILQDLKKLESVESASASQG